MYVYKRKSLLFLIKTRSSSLCKGVYHQVLIEQIPILSSLIMKSHSHIPSRRHFDSDSEHSPGNVFFITIMLPFRRSMRFYLTLNRVF